MEHSHLTSSCRNSNSEGNAELLKEEGKLLKNVEIEKADLTDTAADDYMAALGTILDLKEDMIGELQSKLLAYEESKIA